MHLVRLTQVDFWRILGQALSVCDAEDWLIDGFTLFKAHLLCQSSPHWVLPCKEVFLHCASSIITFSSLTNLVSSELLQRLSDVPDHRVVVLVGVVPEAECHKLEVL